MSIHRGFVWVMAGAMALAAGLAAAEAAPNEAGAAIFAKQCASCHGADGQGSADGYDGPLFGDHSVAVLARLIERTMPEDDPGTCVGEEARQVSEYILHEFY
jgi:mono/diheme cytochrome c family protein